MERLISFNDVLIAPRFSMLRSRKEVDTTIDFLGSKVTTPIVSSNMDTITGSVMANTMVDNGAQACLHRFSSIEDNVKEFKNCLGRSNKPMVSIGVGNNEFERALALVEAGAEILVIDVAHGAQISVVEQYTRLREAFGDNVGIVVGNFATARTIKDFNHHSPYDLQAIKTGIGNGAACTTRLKTGVGIPQLSALMDCSTTNLPMIADGGCKTAGDVIKSIVAGADLVMMGRMLAGTDETPGDLVDRDGVLVGRGTIGKWFKKYRGSASQESYAVQGKDDSWRAAEGEAYLVPHQGSVVNIIQDINGGLRSAMTYVGASNIIELRDNSEFVYVSDLSVQENGPHGK